MGFENHTRLVLLLGVAVALVSGCGGRSARETSVAGIHDRGLALSEMGRIAEAIASLEESLAADPADFAAQRTYWGLRKKQDAETIDEIRRLEAAHPDDSLYPRLLAELDPDPVKRFEAARRAARLEPGVAAVDLALGDAFYDREMPDSAAAAYDRALALDPASAEAYVSRALLLDARGDRAGAEAAYRAGLEHVEGAASRDGIVRRLFGLLWGGGDYPGATRLAEAEGDGVEDPWVLNDMAWTIAESGVRLDLAERLAQRAVDGMNPAWIAGGNPEIDPKWAEAAARRYGGYILDTLGYVRLQAGEVEGAIAALEAAAERVPYVDPDLLKRLAVARREAGRPEGAIDALMTILAVSHDDEARERLEALWVEMHGSAAGLDEAVAARRRERMEPAADFRMATMTGDTLSLSSLRGRVVLLNFWFPT